MRFVDSQHDEEETRSSIRTVGRAGSASRCDCIVELGLSEELDRGDRDPDLSTRLASVNLD